MPFYRGGEPAALVTVGRQSRVHRMWRDRLAELRPGGPVPLPCALQRPGHRMACDNREDHRVPADRRVAAQVRHQVQEPGDTALDSKSSLPGGRTASGQPGGTYTLTSPKRSTVNEPGFDSRQVPGARRMPGALL